MVGINPASTITNIENLESRKHRIKRLAVTIAKPTIALVVVAASAYAGFRYGRHYQAVTAAGEWAKEQLRAMIPNE